MDATGGFFVALKVPSKDVTVFAFLRDCMAVLPEGPAVLCCRSCGAAEALTLGLGG